VLRTRSSPPALHNCCKPCWDEPIRDALVTTLAARFRKFSGRIAAAASRCQSTRNSLPCEIVAEHGGFHFELAESVFHHVANGHDAKNAAIVADDEMPNSVARHSPHDRFDGIVRIAKVCGSHRVLNEHVPDGAQVAIDRFHDVALADESDDRPIRSNNGQPANVVAEEKTNRLRDLSL